MEIINAISIDLEDWYHPELIRKWVDVPVALIEEATQPLLRLLDQYETKASFFILGEVAEMNPGLIKSIYEKGHEIGCHGFSHKPLWNLDRDVFRKELEHFHAVIERILGPVEVKGFRAPTFSMDNRTKWALGVLRDLGYQYDASIFPVKLNRLYGVNGAPLRPYRISLEDVTKTDPEASLIEFPMPMLTFGRIKVPISGGFYLRVCPLPILYWGLKRINDKGPFLVYFHPWEGHVRTPKLKLPLYNRLISYYGCKSALSKVEFLLKHFKFDRVDRVLGLG